MRCETTSKSARYVRAQCIMCTTQACICANVVIGVLVVLCELHVTRVVVVDAVVSLTLGLIAHVVNYSFRRSHIT